MFEPGVRTLSAYDCTSLIQVLDVSVNHPFKDCLKEAMEDELYYLVKRAGEGVLPELDKCDTEDFQEPCVDCIISAVGLHRIA